MIINLTQHPATPEQIAAGVVDLPTHLREDLSKALTFDTLPTKEEIEIRAEYIAALAIFNDLGEDDDPIPTAAMIGGAPWLMGPLAEALRRDHGIEALYAFSVRETEEVPMPDGTVRKVSTFRHVGFVPALFD